LVTRNARTWWRSPWPLLMMSINSVLYGLILGLLFVHMDQTQVGAQEHVSLLFFVVIVVSTSAMTYIPQLFDERPTLYRETAAYAYSSWVYLLAMISVTLPLIFLSGMVVVVPAWAISGLGRGWDQIGYLWGAAVMVAITTYGLILFLSAISADPEGAQGIFGIIFLLNFMTSGFLLVRTEIPPWWIWFYWIAFQHYALEGVLLNELQGQDFDCLNNEGAYAVPVPSENDPHRVQYYCPLESGKDLLEKLDVYEHMQLADICILLAFIGGLFSLSLLVVANVRHIKR